MGQIVDLTVRLIRAGKEAYEKKWSFFGVFFFAFFGSVVVLAELDLLPNTAPATAEAAAIVAAPKAVLGVSTSEPTVAAELPTRIEIPAINLSAIIENPIVTTVAVLDGGLLRGAVRYPTSAKLGEVGNVVLFGHSSYLPVVGNPAYKTFNGIQKLVAGDVVTVYSSGTAYTYRVRSMAKESANDAAIPLDVSGRVLTLATCNSFGAKTDRFVVTADFVESHLISA
ncbi:MAG: sortase [Candidatus Paceibacterota bacterium]|jgi:LPXTG-site transpeptidase (sortase) family protein